MATRQRSTFAIVTVIVGLTLTLQTAFSAAESKDVTFPPPTENHPWHDVETDLRFPHALAGMPCGHGVTYDGEGLGHSLRYHNIDLRIRADVFIYPCSLPNKTSEEMMEAAKQETGQALGDIQQVQERGTYSNIRQGDATYQKIDLIPKGTGQTCLLELPVELTIHEETASGKTEQPVVSYIGMMIFRGHFVKIRCTYPNEGDKATEKQVEDFISKVKRCVLEPGLRDEVKKQIKVYQASPLSPEGLEAAGDIFAYAETTPTLNFTVFDKVPLLGKSLETDLPEASLNMVRAYLVGCVAGGFQDNLPQDAKLEQYGAEEIARLYAVMQKQKPGVHSAQMEEFVKVTKDGRAYDYLADDAPKSQMKKPLIEKDR